MSSFPLSAAKWVLSKALAPVTDGVLEAWTASKNLDAQTDALMTQLHYVQAMLHKTEGREIDNPSLNELLVKLRLLAYDAGDVLDELDYFRIQDVLDGTYHAADTHAGNCVQGFLHHAHHTAKAIVAKVKPACLHGIFSEHEDEDNSSHASPTNQDDKNISAKLMQKLAFITCCSTQSVGNGPQDQPLQTPKLKFNRVAVSLKMESIIQKLKPLCHMVSDILNLELQGSKHVTSATMERSITSEDSLEPKLYGRESEKQRLVDSITHGEYSTNEMTVLPIVGPGGIGKTTFAQHVYQEVKSYFQVTIWISVSLNFSANRLAQEARKKIHWDQDKKEYGSDQEVIGQRLKGKRFLLVLDDIWKCDEDEWEKLLSPFRQGGVKGSMVIVTTRMFDVADIVKLNACQIQLDRLGAKDFRNFFDACVSTKNDSWLDHPELLETGEKIIAKLKGSPLAAKTVGRLLKKQLTLHHWRMVLTCKEWEHQTSDSDIMPALKISYDYLPLNLKQCFSYCALFPEDHEFNTKELIEFWIGLDILSPGDQRIRIEDVGKNYIINLVNYGFFKKYEKENSMDYFVIHDLLHELALKVSRYDCLSIKISEVRYAHIPPSVRHISIVVDTKDVEDTMTYKILEEDLNLLEEKLQVENLRTLMFFGENMENFSIQFGRLLQQARALRAIFFPQESHIVEDMISNFSNLIHLRYLRIKGQRNVEMKLPRTISRLYHLKVLDTEGCWGCSIPAKDLNNLSNMEHFLVPDNSHQPDIFEVGTMKKIRKLRRFKVKKEENGFELKELGQLLELEMLGIYNLEKVKLREEAYEAKLSQKQYLQELILDWDADRSDKDVLQEDNILESLKPNSNLYKLCVKGHGGATCPLWLGVNLSLRTLESLELNDISWTSLPPLGEVWLVDEHGAEYKSQIPGQGFTNLKRLELVQIPKLRKWLGNGPSELFSHLKEIVIRNCPELVELPFSDPAWFPKLEELEITNCPKLQSFPCIPWSGSTRSAIIEHAGQQIEQLSFREYSSTLFMLDIIGKDALDSAVWSVLNLGKLNLSKLAVLYVWRCPPVSLVILGHLSSLKALTIGGSSDAFSLIEGDDHARCQCPVEYVTIAECGSNGEQLTHLLSCFPKLRSFKVRKSENVTGFGVLDQQIGVGDQQRGDDEIAAAVSEGLLLLPPQLQSLEISDFPNLVLCSNSFDGSKNSEETGYGGGDLQCLRFLQTLQIRGCPKLLSSYSSSSSSSSSSISRFPFPASLDYLSLDGTVGAETVLPLSNLTSLTFLYIDGCGDLRGEGLWSLLTEGCLENLSVGGTPNFFTISEPSLPSLPPKLQSLQTECIPKVLTAPICSLLSSSLIELDFIEDKEIEHFTKDQDEALQLLTSLKYLGFQHCTKMQGLPPGLHRIPNLKTLLIFQCPAIRSLPKYGLPSTLQDLKIIGCPAIQSLPKDHLPSSLQKLVIESCPAIQSIPKADELPSLLRELYVQNSESMELRRQCRKLVGTIPVVRA